MTHGAIVLCGGLSSRMGRPKALLPWRPWNGTTLVEHVVNTLRQVVEDVVVVTSSDLKLPKLDARIVYDRTPGLGPLAGIREGLEAVSAQLAFATSTDAPFLTPQFVKAMLAFESAAAPEIDGVIQSLSAVYPKSLASVASDLIQQKRMRLSYLIEAAHARRVTAGELPDVDSTRGFNTPADYLAAVRGEQSPRSVHVEIRGRAHSKTNPATFETVAATVREILVEAGRRYPLVRIYNADEIDSGARILLNGELWMRDLAIPIGPGETLTIEF